MSARRNFGDELVVVGEVLEQLPDVLVDLLVVFEDGHFSPPRSLPAVDLSLVCAHCSSIAIPWPPPMHSVTRPRSWSRRSISYRIFVVITAPVAAIGWPSAIAPPLGFTFSAVEVEILHHRQRLGRERLVQLDHVDVVERPAGPLQRLAHRRHGADAHDLGVHAAVGVGQDPAAHRRAELLRLLRRHQHHGGARVVHARGVAGRHGAVRLEHRLQLAERPRPWRPVARARRARTRSAPSSTSARRARSARRTGPAPARAPRAGATRPRTRPAARG